MTTTTPPARVKALLLDIGDVIVTAPWVAFDALEKVIGRPVPGRGPLDPDNDPLWQRHLAGELDILAYWDGLADAAGFAGWRALYRAACDADPDALFDQDAVALMRDAKAAGLRVGALSNDGVSINGPEFFRERPEFAALDVFLDATETGVRKPHRAAYTRAVAELGVEAHEVLFLDDTPMCVEGAEAAGMRAVLVDPTKRAAAFDEARRSSGLAPMTDAEALVAAVEAAYQAFDLDAVLAYFHADAVVRWNGSIVAVGRDEVKQFHLERLGFAAPMAEFRICKHLRAAQGDVVTVEWTTSYVDDDRVRFEGRGVEVWTMRDGTLVTWHANHHARAMEFVDD